MNDTGSWILMFVSIVVGLFGLVLASRAGDTGMYVAGLLFFGFGVLFCFSQISAMFNAEKDAD